MEEGSISVFAKAFLKFTLFVSPLFAFAQPNEGPTSTPKCENFISRSVSGISGRRLNFCESEFAFFNPVVFTEIVSKALYTHELIVNFCRLPRVESIKELEGDEESDALRHFVFSAALAWYLPLRDATYFLRMHELSVDGSVSESNKMDIFNNSMGLNYAARLQAKRLSEYFDWKSALFHGIRHLLSGQLKVLRKGNSFCSRLENMTALEIEYQLQSTFRRMHEQSPQPPPFLP